MRTRLVPASAIPEEFRKLSKTEEQTVIAMQELADWCIRNQHLLEKGRNLGFRMGVTSVVKDIIALASSTPDQAARINGNLFDIPS